MSFEVERFEWTADDRLELVGRWFDVRGRRFLRPTLEMEVAGSTRRLLATLEHKPWAAEEGERWLAAFAWEGDAVDIEAVQLVVAPDLAIELAPPAATPGDRSRRTKHVGRELAATRAEVKRLRTTLERERDALRAEAADLREGLADAEASTRSLRAELNEARERASSAQAGAAQREEAVGRERDAAVAERRTLAAELEVAKQERDAAHARLRSVESELQAAACALEVRESWLSRARDAEAERDAALASRDAVRRESESASNAVRTAREVTPAAPTPSPREAAPTPATLAGQGATRILHPRIRARSASAGQVRWAARVMVILALLLVVAALVLLLFR